MLTKNTREKQLTIKNKQARGNNENETSLMVVPVLSPSIPPNLHHAAESSD